METRRVHPRPDFMRETFASLDGMWSFAFDDANAGLAGRWYEPGQALPMMINVPFCYQCEMSGIGTDEIHPVIWYRRQFEVPAEMRGKRLLLRFNAVDWSCQVWVNGMSVGYHEGGYTPFALDITHALNPYPDAPNDICVRVVDTPDTAQPRGKQYWMRGLMGCWYTPVSGIWQSVYLEAAGVPTIKRVHVEPDVDRGIAIVHVALEEAPAAPVSVAFGIDANVDDGVFPDRPLVMSAAMSSREASFPIEMHTAMGLTPFAEVKLWSPERPNLYGLTVSVFTPDSVADRVSTYFGMRKIESRDGEIFLNNAPLYQRLILDQGYWPGTLLTPPSDEALAADITWSKAFGFNGARKHQKIEDPRWYYWADRMGFLVWGELPSAYVFTQDSVRMLTETMDAFIDRDYNHPSIIAWTPLNESWGVPDILSDKKQQDFARALYTLCKAKDGTRLVSGNDGWEQVRSDIFALHDYTQSGDILAVHIADRARINRVGLIGRKPWVEGEQPDDGEPFLLTEYGGIAFDYIGAQGEMGGMQTWGYGDKMHDEASFIDRFAGIQRAVFSSPFCRGTCYTQLTDVMQEINGLLTPDRVPKINPEQFAVMNGEPVR